MAISKGAFGRGASHLIVSRFIHRRVRLLPDSHTHRPSPRESSLFNRMASSCTPSPLKSAEIWTIFSPLSRSSASFGNRQPIGSTSAGIEPTSSTILLPRLRKSVAIANDEAKAKATKSRKTVLAILTARLRVTEVHNAQSLTFMSIATSSPPLPRRHWPWISP